MGDDFELKEYQRKTELVCSEQSLNNSYRNVQPGEKQQAMLVVYSLDIVFRTIVMMLYKYSINGMI